MSHQHRGPVSSPSEIGSEAVVSTLGRRGVLAGLLGGGAALGGVALAGAAPAVGAPALPVQGPFVAKSVMPVNVRDHGAAGDGEVDDSVAIQSAISAAGETGRSVFFPAGTYLVSASIEADGPTRLVGEGMWLTTVVLTSDESFVDAGTHARVLILEDMAFDSFGEERPAFDIHGSAIDSVVFRRCRFTNLAGGIPAPGAVTLASFGDGEFIDCMWHNPAAYAGQGKAIRVLPDATGRRLSFRGNNRFLWLQYGLSVGSGSGFRRPGFPDSTVKLVEIDGAYFDGFWWLLPAHHEGEGSGVTYGGSDGTELSDPAADFGDVPTGGGGPPVSVRAMPVLRAGVMTSSSGAVLVDDDADFGSVGVKRGEIVRSDGKFAVVVGVGSTSVNALQVEGWLDSDSLLPTEPPPAGAAYTLYSVFVTHLRARTVTTLQVRTWHDLHGNAVVPPDGTRYEVPKISPIYSGALINPGVLNLRVTNCTFRRIHADSMGCYAQRAQIIGNLFEDGQDMGCTVQGWFEGHEIVGNVFNHNGTSGLYINADQAVVVGNRGRGNRWHRSGPTNGADIWASSLTRSYVGFNSSEGGPESVSSVQCVSLHQADEPSRANGNVAVTESNVLERNRRFGSDDESDIRVWGSNVRDNEIIAADSILYLGGAQGQYVDTNGEGSPEGELAASPGSIYRRTDGDGGASLFVKQSGSGATGWVAK